ncbi:hypothetical protein CF326_g3370 [Tilletia indica]|nr:hypothetical protein CF326_g3370 [Tilletia indica]
MRFRWSYYYDDLAEERKSPTPKQHPASHSSSSSSSSSLPQTLPQNPLSPNIPYLIYPTYSGDVLAIDYHAAHAASAASTPADIARIARDEANYAAQVYKTAQALAKQQRKAMRDERKKRRQGTKSLQSAAESEGAEGEDPRTVFDNFESTSFALEDLLPQLHGPSLPHSPSSSSSSSREEEAAARRRAAAVVRLGAGILPSGWQPPPSTSSRGLFSLFSSSSSSSRSRPSKPITASMPQRMAALGTMYTLGIIALDSSSQLGGIDDPWSTRRNVAEGGGGGSGNWSFTNSEFSAWFPPPYRVLTLVALGILVFAADILVLSRLGIDPVPLLFPPARRRARTGRRGSLPLLLSDAHPTSSSVNGQMMAGLGPNLTTPHQLTRALFLLGSTYTLLALGGWFSFRVYVDSSFFMGDGSGRHAQVLQGLAIALALGVACWPGRRLYKSVRVAFWVALGRLLWPTSEGVPLVVGTSGGARNGQPLAEEMADFDREGGEDDDLLTNSGRSTPTTLEQKLRLALHRLQLSIRDTRRWFLPTQFSAVILADVLTSFAKVFADVWLTACFLVPRKEHHTWWNGRGSVVVPILTSLPYLIRLRQCISEYLSTSLRSKHAHSAGSPHQRPSRRPLFNALKYFSALPVIWLAALEGFASSELAKWEAGLGAEGRVEVLGAGVGVVDGSRMVRTELWDWGEEARWRQRMIWRCWVFWVFFNSIFSFWWDVTYDWGLDMFRLRTVSHIISTSSPSDLPPQPHQHHHRRALSTVILRPATTPLLFPEWAYHLTIILDLILRFTWSIKLSSQLYRYADWEGGVFLLEAGEILRRGAWVVLRFEHAALGMRAASRLGAVGAGVGTGTSSVSAVGSETYVDEEGEEEEGGSPRGVGEIDEEEAGKNKLRWAA